MNIKPYILYGFLLLLWLIQLWAYWSTWQKLVVGDVILIRGEVTRSENRFYQGSYVTAVRVSSGFFSYYADLDPSLHLVRGDSIRLHAKVKDLLDVDSYVPRRWALEDVQVVDLSNEFAWLTFLRNRSLVLLQRALPAPHAGLAAGILLGDESLSPDFFRDQARNVGLTHIMAVSGYNISLVIFIFSQSIVNFFNKKRSLWISLLVVWIFIFIVGFSPSVVRAGVMSSLIVLGALYGRVRNISRIFLLSALISLCCYPYWVLDVGWQLSFLATAGLLWINPLVEKFISMDGEAITTIAGMKFIGRYVYSSLLQTIAVLVMTAPWMLYIFSEMQFMVIISNVLVLWLLPLLTVLGFALLALALCFPLIGVYGIQILWLPLDYVVAVIDFLQPFAINFSYLHISLSAIFVYYFLLVCLITYAFRKGYLK